MGAKGIVKVDMNALTIFSVLYADGKMIVESRCPRLEGNIMVLAVLWQVLLRGA